MREQTAAWRRGMAMGLVCALAWPGFVVPVAAQQAGGGQDIGFVLREESDLVLTNVVVRDGKTGAVVEGLTQADFTVLEDGKAQGIASFDFESVDRAKPLDEATVRGVTAGLPGGAGKGSVRPEELKNHRLIVFFFDLTSMQPDDLDRAVAAARDFLKSKMQAADLVALVSLDTGLRVDQDFSSDREMLAAKVGIYNGTAGAGFAQGATASSNQVEDASGYTADESEYNDINTDRELLALRTIAKSLEGVNQRKSLLYFSGGLTRDGVENQASLRAAIQAAVRSNLAVYSVDARGLQAVSPVGDASTGSLRGTGAYNGGAIQNNMNANFASQETLTTLSADTGGKAFLDSNDFAPAFAQVQKDTSAYYVIGYHPTNGAKDGKYRRLTVKVNRPGLKLEYRQGYYAQADYLHAGREDRERQLEEQLGDELPATDVAMYLETYFFQLDERRFYVPVSLIVPGSQIPFVAGGDKDKATLDVVGEVLDEGKRPIGRVRETVKLAVSQEQQARQKNIQYTTSFNLPPGKYGVKFVVRENQTGKMGSFETEIVLPDMRKQALKLSSVVLAAQTVAVKAAKDAGPLVRNGQELVPNISHVFRVGQELHLLCEVYGAARVKAAEGGPKPAKNAVRVLGSLELMSGTTKVYETPAVVATTVSVPERDAVVLEFVVPLAELKAGSYVGQLNVVDDAGGSFGFPRFAVVVRGE